MQFITRIVVLNRLSYIEFEKKLKGGTGGKQPTIFTRLCMKTNPFFFDFANQSTFRSLIESDESVCVCVCVCVGGGGYRKKKGSFDLFSFTSTSFASTSHLPSIHSIFGAEGGGFFLPPTPHLNLILIPHFNFEKKTLITSS